mmetsp:Transcript_15461/g.39137  ORF Transcript_15461/g.39137 Transcript_15461/m.39137 type:complete len:226 (+) Transcript_15461:535-1212(+)
MRGRCDRMSGLASRGVFRGAAKASRSHVACLRGGCVCRRGQGARLELVREASSAFELHFLRHAETRSASPRRGRGCAPRACRRSHRSRGEGGCGTQSKPYARGDGSGRSDGRRVRVRRRQPECGYGARCAGTARLVQASQPAHVARCRFDGHVPSRWRGCSLRCAGHARGFRGFSFVLYAPGFRLVCRRTGSETEQRRRWRPSRWSGRHAAERTYRHCCEREGGR